MIPGRLGMGYHDGKGTNDFERGERSVPMREDLTMPMAVISVE